MDPILSQLKLVDTLNTLCFLSSFYTHIPHIVPSIAPPPHPQVLKSSLRRVYTKVKKKGKGVPLHAMEAHGGRGSIAPTHT
jgi:hypothetical protein